MGFVAFFSAVTLGEEEMKAEAELQRRLEAERSKKPKFVPPPSYKHERKHPLPGNNALLYGKVAALSHKFLSNAPTPVPTHSREPPFYVFSAASELL